MGLQGHRFQPETVWVDVEILISDKEEGVLYRKGQLTEEAARSFSQGNAKNCIGRTTKDKKRHFLLYKTREYFGIICLQQ